MPDWNVQNPMVIREFRTNSGQVGGYFADKPLLLLTNKGAKTGRVRTNPLGYMRDGESYVVFASLVGSPNNPAWYYNVLANPEVTVEVGSDKFMATAFVADDEQRDRLWQKWITLHPQFATYQAMTKRQIPVVVLIPHEK